MSTMNYLGCFFIGAAVFLAMSTAICLTFIDEDTTPQQYAVMQWCMLVVAFILAAASKGLGLL